MMENALHRGKNQPESERPAKRLARQLDFTGFSASSTSLILPEHPLIATATSPRPHQKRMQSQAPYPFNRSIKLESSRGRRRSNAEAKDVNPKKQKHCNCKHSKCLKLYCECFASGVYCDGCNCVNCHNDVDMEDARREAIESTLERNPSAFKPKIASSPRGAKEDATEDVIIGRHNKGCHCKKSGCLKKYCECFQANILCSENCKCMDCKNSEGNERRRAIFHGENANNLMYPQQGANDVITGAISSSRYDSSPLPKRRKGQEPLYGTNKMSIRTLQELQQAKKMRSSLHSPSLSSVAFARNENVVALTSSKLTYRSLLAGIVQPEDLKELCSVLVVHSKDTARELSDEKTDKPESYQTFPKQEDSFQSGTEDNQTQCPVSPGTLALLCDEHDTNVVPNPPKLPYLEGISEIYAKQERIVLTKFLCCLSKIVTLGEIRETKCSSGSRTESGSLQNLIMAQGLNES